MCEAVIAIFQWFQFGGIFCILSQYTKIIPQISPNIETHGRWTLVTLCKKLTQFLDLSFVWRLDNFFLNHHHWAFWMYLEHLQADGTSSAESLQQLRPKRFLACAREPMLDAEGGWCPCFTDGLRMAQNYPEKLRREMEIFEGFPIISFHSSPVCLYFGESQVWLTFFSWFVERKASSALPWLQIQRIFQGPS